MSARILYHEQGGSEADGQMVRVELRLWKDGGHHDLILESTVMSDGPSLPSLRPLAESHVGTVAGRTDAEAIRFAIAIFDELVAAHPHAEALRKEVAP